MSAAVLCDLLQLHDRKRPGHRVEGGGKEKTISITFHQTLLSYLCQVVSQVFLEQSLFHGLSVFSIYVPELSGICTHQSQNHSLAIGRKITDLNLIISSTRELAFVDKLHT